MFISYLSTLWNIPHLRPHFPQVLAAANSKNSKNHSFPFGGSECVDIFMCATPFSWIVFCFGIVLFFAPQRNMLSCTRAPNGIQMHNCCRLNGVWTSFSSWHPTPVFHFPFSWSCRLNSLCVHFVVLVFRWYWVWVCVGYTRKNTVFGSKIKWDSRYIAKA